MFHFYYLSWCCFSLPNLLKRRPRSGYIQSRTFFCVATFPDPAPNPRKHRPGVILESKKLGRCCLEPKNQIINAAPRSSSMCPVRAGKSNRAGHMRGQFFLPFPRVSSPSHHYHLFGGLVCGTFRAGDPVSMEVDDHCLCSVAVFQLLGLEKNTFQTPAATCFTVTSPGFTKMHAISYLRKMYLWITSCENTA